MTRKQDARSLLRGLLFLTVLVALPMTLLVEVVQTLHADDSHISGPPHAPVVPVALAWPEPDRLLVALRDDHALLSLNPESHKTIRRIPLEFPPISLHLDPDGAPLLGGQNGLVESLNPDGTLRFLRPVGRGPAELVSLPDNRLAASALWDRRILVLDKKSGTELARHALPFEPGQMLPLPDGRLLITDAFTGRFAILRPGEPGSEHLGQLDAVNIRGLSLSADQSEVLLVHMASSGPTQVTRTNVDWGLVLASKLTAVRLSDLDQPRPPFRRLNLDGSGHGAADPSAIAVSPDGNLIYVSTSGAHQVLFIDRRLGGAPAPDLHPLGDSNRIQDAEVGQSPLALALDPSGAFLATADAMSDTLSLLSARDLKPLARISLSDSTVQRTPVQRGEALFLDGRRALDRWISCASCHPGGHTISLRFDTLGDGTYGNPKDTPSLLGVRQTAPYAWTGRFRRLEDQVEQSLLTSLHGPPPSASQVADLVAYLHSLEPPPALDDGAGPDTLANGRELFQARRCDACHTPPSYSSQARKNPAIEGVSGLYSPPSLLGADRTAPYFHDASAPSLESALERHHPGFQTPPDTAQIEVLAAYLRSLGGSP